MKGYRMSFTSSFTVETSELLPSFTRKFCHSWMYKLFKIYIVMFFILGDTNILQNLSCSICKKF